MVRRPFGWATATGPRCRRTVSWVACIVSDGPRTSLDSVANWSRSSANDWRFWNALRARGMVPRRPEDSVRRKRTESAGRELSCRTCSGAKPVPLTPEGVGASHVSPDQKYLQPWSPGLNSSLFPIRGGELKPDRESRAWRICDLRWSGDGRFRVPTKVRRTRIFSRSNV